MEQSWEANSLSVLWHPKLSLFVHKTPSLEPILNQMSPAHTLTIYGLIVHISVILTSTPSSPSFLYSFQVFQIIILPAQIFFLSSTLLHVQPNLSLITIILFDEENNL